MKSRWRRCNGVAVFHLDYAGFKHDVAALRVEVRAADDVIVGQPEGSVLVLIDLRDTVASGDVVQLFKESSAETTPHIRRHALLGVTGIKRFLADKVARLAGRPMRLFSTEEEALAWLTRGEGEGEGEGDTIGVP